MATDYEGIVPRGVADDFLAAISRDSVALRLGNTRTMSEATESLPVVSFMPQAGWTTSRYGGRKPATKIEWSKEAIVPEEVAATLAIPENWITDAGFDVWGNVRPTLVTALSRVIDDAILFGIGEPANFPATGVFGGQTPVTGPAPADDAFAALDAGFDVVEGRELEVTGIAASLRIRSPLRKEYRAIGATPDTVPTLAYSGVPIATTPGYPAVDAGAPVAGDYGDAVLGDFRLLVIGVREDMAFRTTDTGVLQDGAGAIIANMFQDNLVALKVWMKLGVAIGEPVKPDNSGTVFPFQPVDWTP